MENDCKKLINELKEISLLLKNIDENLSGLKDLFRLKGIREDPHNNEVADKVLSVKETSKVLGISRSTLYLINKNSDFPLAVKLTDRRTGYLYSEIIQYIKLIKGKS